MAQSAVHQFILNTQRPPCYSSCSPSFSCYLFRFSNLVRGLTEASIHFPPLSNCWPIFSLSTRQYYWGSTNIIIIIIIIWCLLRSSFPSLSGATLHTYKRSPDQKKNFNRPTYSITEILSVVRLTNLISVLCTGKVKSEKETIRPERKFGKACAVIPTS